MSPPAFTFRRLTDQDLPLLHRWLNEPGVVRWWEGEDVSWEAVQREYGRPQTDSTEYWLALDADGEPFGWAQCYDAFDSDEESPHWFAAGVDRSAAGIDYLLGEPAARGRGLGSAMLAAFAAQVVFADGRSWTQACASPYTDNQASWRALARAGFRKVGVWHDEDGAECTIMVIDRPHADR